MEQPYVPISCSFHDQLLALATLRRECEIRYRRSTGEEVVVTARIEDVYSRSGAEFTRLSSGEVVRLDLLVSVDGLPLPPADPS